MTRIRSSPQGSQRNFSESVLLTGTGNWTVPEAVIRLKVIVIGSGGAGADADLVGGTSGGGGGSGGFAEGFFDVAPGQSIAYEVGPTSYFSSPAEIYADAGSDANGPAPGLGGNAGGSKALLVAQGGSGFAGTETVNLVGTIQLSLAAEGGSGGSGPYSGNAAGGFNGGDGQDGVNFGGGGGGGANNIGQAGNGGVGANGVIIVYY